MWLQQLDANDSPSAFHDPGAIALEQPEGDLALGRLAPGDLTQGKQLLDRVGDKDLGRPAQHLQWHRRLVRDDPERPAELEHGGPGSPGDRKSTRLNSSHGYISYAVFCLKKKK